MHKTINEAPIRRFLNSEKVTEISIFSFAIYNDADRRLFNSLIKDQIEALLNVKIVEVLTVPEIMKVCQQVDMVHYDGIVDFMQLNGKFFAFLKYCKTKHQHETSLLIDDVVKTTTLIIHEDPETIIKTQNVNELKNHKLESPGIPIYI
jgi:hypothetical protein